MDKLTFDLDEQSVIIRLLEESATKRARELGQIGSLEEIIYRFLHEDEKKIYERLMS